jgi:hypothetical protein
MECFENGTCNLSAIQNNCGFDCSQTESFEGACPVQAASACN